MQTFPLVLFFPFFFIGIGNGFIWPISIAGAVTINQHLRGSASGLHGASMYMIGAIFSSILAIWISQSNGIWPIYFVLTVSTVLGILVISRFNLEKKKISGHLKIYTLFFYRKMYNSSKNSQQNIYYPNNFI